MYITEIKGFVHSIYSMTCTLLKLRALYTLFIAWHVHNREPRRARLGRGSSAFCRTSNKRSPSSSCSGLWALCQTGTSWNISFTISMIQRWWKWYWFFFFVFRAVKVIWEIILPWLIQTDYQCIGVLTEAKDLAPYPSFCEHKKIIGI